MRALALLLLIAACGSRDAGEEAAPRRALTVRVDRRIELVSLAARLAKSPGFADAPATAYVRELDRAFASRADHPAVKMTRELDVAGDDLMRFALALDDRYQLRDAVAIGAHWRTIDPAQYATALRSFAAATEFDAFFDRHAAAFARLSDTLRTVVESDDPMGWLDATLGPRGAAFTVVPSPGAGPQAHLVHLPNELYRVVGVRRPDGMVGTDDDTLAGIFLGLAHAHVDPIVDRAADKLRVPGEALHKSTAARMAHQGTWAGLLKTSTVRALAALRLQERKGTATASDYPWTQELVEVFARARARGAPMTADELVAFFTSAARA